MSWAIGVVINVVGNVGVNLGQNIMKLGFNKREEIDMPEELKPSIVKFRAWQIGMAVFIIGNVLNFASFAFAAQSLLAALGSVQFVANVVFASLVLKEKVTFLILVSTALIIGGCLMLVFFGDQSSSVYTFQELIALYGQPLYIIYLVAAAVSFFGLYIVYLHGKQVSRMPGREHSAWVQVLPVAYSLFSAIVGTQAVIFSKSLSTLLRVTFEGDNQFTNWYTYVTLLCFIIAAGFWTVRLNKGLRMFSVMVIVPLLQISWVLLSIISGLIYFEEYKGFDVLNGCMFGLGILIVLIGVYLITLNAKRQMLLQGRELYETMLAKDAAESELDKTPRLSHSNAIFDPQGSGMLLGFANVGLASTINPVSPSRPHSVHTSQVWNEAHANSSMASTALSTLRPGGAPKLRGSAATDRDALHDTMSTDQVHAGAIGRDAAAGSARGGKESLMSTMRRGVRSLRESMRGDLGIYDSTLNKQVAHTGLFATSVYSIPMGSLPKRGRQRQTASEDGTQRHADLSERMSEQLPQSRFHAAGSSSGGGAKHAKPRNLETIQEVSHLRGASAADSDLAAAFAAASAGPDGMIAAGRPAAAALELPPGVDASVIGREDSSRAALVAAAVAAWAGGDTAHPGGFDAQPKAGVQAAKAKARTGGEAAAGSSSSGAASSEDGASGSDGGGGGGGGSVPLRLPLLDLSRVVSARPRSPPLAGAAAPTSFALLRGPSSRRHNEHLHVKFPGLAADGGADGPVTDSGRPHHVPPDAPRQRRSSAGAEAGGAFRPGPTAADSDPRPFTSPASASASPRPGNDDWLPLLRLRAQALVAGAGAPMATWPPPAGSASLQAPRNAAAALGATRADPAFWAPIEAAADAAAAAPGMPTAAAAFARSATSLRLGYSRPSYSPAGYSPTSYSPRVASGHVAGGGAGHGGGSAAELPTRDSPVRLLAPGDGSLGSRAALTGRARMLHSYSSSALAAAAHSPPPWQQRLAAAATPAPSSSVWLLPAAAARPATTAVSAAGMQPLPLPLHMMRPQTAGPYAGAFRLPASHGSMPLANMPPGVTAGSPIRHSASLRSHTPPPPAFARAGSVGAAAVRAGAPPVAWPATGTGALTFGVGQFGAAAAGSPQRSLRSAGSSRAWNDGR